MSKRLGFSVYVSHFDRQKPFLKQLTDQQFLIFTSLHISEEMDQEYIDKVESMCRWLSERDFYVIADVSPVTIETFDEPSLGALAKRLKLDNVRLDYGFDLKVIEQNEELDLTFNASTVQMNELPSRQVLYMHNFYPRPETGLEAEQLMTMNQVVRSVKGELAAFISGDEESRGPIFEGLPTLEVHRHQAPYAQYVDLVKRYEIDKVFVGDVRLSQKELNLILDYMHDQRIRIPVDFSEADDYLYNQPFTVRVDSPSTLIRVQESREYAQPGRRVVPQDTEERTRGAVTLDNETYKRYSGEVQITKKDYPADKRVNVIGRISPAYHLLLDNLKGGDTFLFVRPK